MPANAPTGRLFLTQRNVSAAHGKERLDAARIGRAWTNFSSPSWHGFDKASAADLHKRLIPLIRKTQPYTKRIARKGIWVEPELLAEIEYRAKSAEGKVRHPFFKGLREDL